MKHTKTEIVMKVLSVILDAYKKDPSQSFNVLRTKAENEIAAKLSYDSYTGIQAHLVGKGTKFKRTTDQLDSLIEAWITCGSDSLRDYFLQMISDKQERAELNSYFESAIELPKLPEEITQGQQFYEGAKQMVAINKYERNKKARDECIKHYSAKCCVCGFSFEKIYGDIGKNFIHVHHLVSLSKIGKDYEVNPIQDLRPVCPNCHAIIHRKDPHYSIDDVQKMIQTTASK